MTYRFVSRNGEAIERDFDFAGPKPDMIEVNGQRFYFARMLAPSVNVPEHHRAATYAGRDGDRKLARHYRCNKEAAEGLANGTMMENPERPIFGEEQPRESKVQFNRMYDEAKGRTSPQR